MTTAEKLDQSWISPRPGIAAYPQRSPDLVRTEVDERDLIVAAQKGDRDAFGAIVRQHQRKAYAIARAIVFVHEDAEDAVQEAFLRAFQAIGRFRLGEPFSAWLSRIVANASLDIARRRKIRTAEELPESLSSRFEDPGESDELRTRLRAALLGLGERQRTVIVLHDVEGYTHVEISAMLGIPEGTARSDLHHARRHLRKALRDLRDVGDEEVLG